MLAKTEEVKRLPAETKGSPSGQYTTKLTCRCGTVSYGNNHYGQTMGGHKCSGCGKKI